MEFKVYTKTDKKQWDQFIDNADNGTFLFKRDYIEYHSDRFTDHSLLVFHKDKLIALIPANIDNDKFFSHQGLTFGGIVFKPNLSFQKINNIIIALNEHLTLNKFKSMRIKIQPYFYSKNQQQAEALTYQLLQLESSLNIGAVINCSNHQFPKRCIRTNKLDEYNYKLSNQLESFWSILEYNLENYHNAKPVHTLNEIKYLQGLFPNNIALVVVKHKDTGLIHSGAILYINKQTVKVQYLATSDEGRNNRSSDILYYQIINSYRNQYSYIDFGTNMNPDNTINNSLIQTKEKFGASIYPVITYEKNF